MDKEHNNDPNIIRVAAANRFDSLDILFIGSSASYSGINPVFFDSIGMRTYNLSIAAAGPFFYELLVNDYLRSISKKPKSVFILLSPSSFINAVDDFSSFGIHRYLNQPVSNEKIAQQYSGWHSYPSLCLKSFQRGVKNILSTEVSATTIAKQTIAQKGFYPSDEITSVEKEKNEMQSNLTWKLQKFDTGRVNYLDHYLASIQKQGIEVVLFSLPSNKLVSFFSNTYLNEYRDAMTELGKNYVFVDLSSESLSSICYRNSDHLNTQGAAVVTRKMIAMMQTNKHLNTVFGLPSHSN